MQDIDISEIAQMIVSSDYKPGEDVAEYAARWDAMDDDLRLLDARMRQMRRWAWLSQIAALEGNTADALAFERQAKRAYDALWLKHDIRSRMAA